MVHSSFMIIFPLHLLYLITMAGHNLSGLLSGLCIALAFHLTNSPTTPTFPWRRFVYLLTFMLIGVTLPGLLWFAAITMSP
jgi:hypothetical protein